LPAEHPRFNLLLRELGSCVGVELVDDDGAMISMRALQAVNKAVDRNQDSEKCISA
jgi:hypothetical protein